MRDLEPSWSEVVSVWWLIVWRGTFGALLSSIGTGFLIGLIGHVEGASLGDVRTLAAVVGLTLGIFWQIYAVRMALRKHYHGFHLTVVPG